MHISITYIIIGLNVAVFLFLQGKPEILAKMLFITSRVLKNKEYDRLFLSGFAHAGIIHLAFNMLTLYFFGPALEEYVGPTLFLILFLLSIIGGNIYCMFMRREVADYSALGASGGLLGVIFGFILISPMTKLSLFIIPVGIPGWLFGILFTIISIVLTQLPKADAAMISHEGHLGGAATGGLIIMAFGKADIMLPQVQYFILGAILPILLFALIKAISPSSIYRHLR